jgi:hypothetical protein
LRDRRDHARGHDRAAGRAERAQALALSRREYVPENGRVALSVSGEAPLGDEHVRRA